MEQEKKVKALDRYLMPGDVWALTSVPSDAEKKD